MKIEITEAIARSVSHNEIVRVKVTNLEASLDEIDGIEGVENSDYTQTEDLASESPMIDFWGDYKGKEFRIYLIQE